MVVQRCYLEVCHLHLVNKATNFEQEVLGRLQLELAAINVQLSNQNFLIFFFTFLPNGNFNTVSNSINL